METNKKALDIAELIIRHKNNALSEQEQEELRTWANASAQNRTLYDSLMREQQALQPELDFISEVNVQAAWQKVAKATGQVKQPEPKVIPLWKQSAVWRNVAAVLLILGIAVTVYKFGFNNAANSPEGAMAVNTTEILPAETDRAVLILQDGSKIDLDSLHNGTLTELNGVKMISEDGMLKIDASALTTASSSLIAYNTIATPRGVHYQVVLPDGSKVWLNAASSLKFPTAFAGKERRVELTGEAYFEVVKDKKQFIVNTGEIDVAVLGTSFNVSAYAEDKDISTTLVTGRVQLSGADKNVTDLTPGKRAVYTKASKRMTVSQVDTEIYIVWKEGKLYFENEELETIITKLGRWYDVDAVYLDNYSRNKTFTGVAYTNKPLDKLLGMISETTNVTFEKKGDKLLIKKK